MDKEKWHERYIQQLVDMGGINSYEATNILEDGMGDHDYNEDPEDAADTEMSYWTDDG